MREEKKQFSNMRPETREILLMKYYSNMFENVYQSNEFWKKKRREFLKRQEKRFQATRERNYYYSKEKYWK